MANNKGETIVVALAGETNRALRRRSIAERFDLNLAAEIRNRERYPAVGDDFHAGRFRCVTITRSFVNTASSGRSASTKNQSWVIRVPCVGRTVMSFSPPSQVKSTSEGSAWGTLFEKSSSVLLHEIIATLATSVTVASKKLVHLLHIVRIVLYV